MSLSNDLISQFVKVVNDPGKHPINANVNGTVVEQNGVFKVRLDGSDILTPVNTTAEVKNNERVLVRVSDHAAMIIGNASAPSASLKTVNQKYGEFDVVKADYGEFKILVVDNLTAINAEIENLTAEYGEFKKLVADDLKANIAEIQTLVAEKISADEADIRYVRVDLAEMDEAWVEDLLVHGSFLTTDVNSATGSFSKYLTGVNIHGDLIEANTLKADTLIIQGTDGIYRRLNIDSLGQAVVDSDPKYNTKLDGSILVANSITADKINVTDLFAQDITATGTITGIRLNGATGYFTGSITANEGSIGIFEISDNGLYAMLPGSDVMDYIMRRDVFRAVTYPTNTPTSYSDRGAEFSLHGSGLTSLYSKTNFILKTDTFIIRNANDTAYKSYFDADGLTVYGYLSTTGYIDADGESKFRNTSYGLIPSDSAPGVACAFKASRGLFNEALIDKFIMPLNGQGEFPFYKYTGTSGGQMTGLTKIASISKTGTFSGAGLSVTGTISANNATIDSTLDVKGAILARGGLELYHSTTPYFDFHYGNHSGDYTSRIIETASGTLAVNGVQCKTGGHLTVPGTTDITGITTVKARIQPNTSISTVNLGYNDVANSRWANIYSKTSVNVSSDIKVKTDLAEIDERYILLFDLLMPYSYKFIDGTSGRTHTGFIAQHVEEALIQVGLSAMDLAFFCKDAMIEEIRDDEGNVINTKPLLDENGNQVYFYSLRYEEYIAITSAKIKYMERKFEKRLRALESKGENQNG